MKPRAWLLPLVFLGISVPTVLLLHAVDIGGDFRIVIAIGAGALGAAITQARMGRSKDDR